MLTFGTRAFLSDEALYQALEKKVAGAIRSAISNCSHVGPVGAGQGHGRPTRCRPSGSEKKGILEARAKKVQEILSSPRVRRPLGAVSLQRRLLHVPEAQGLDAETYRKHLLEKYGVGVIADGERDIRIAFSSVEVGELEDLYGLMATAARELLDGEKGAK